MSMQRFAAARPDEDTSFAREGKCAYQARAFITGKAISTKNMWSVSLPVHRL